MKINRKVILYMIATAILVIRSVVAYICFNYTYVEDKNYSAYIVKVISVERYNEKTKSFVVQLKDEEKFSDKFILNIYDTPNIDIGKDDIVFVSGKIKIPYMLNNPGEFNYKRYLSSRGIYGTITAKSVETVQKSIKETDIKLQISKNVDKALSAKYASLLKSMMYGEKLSLDTSIEENFKSIGIAHIISVSGSNIAIIIVILDGIFKKVKFNKYIKFIFQTIFILLFFSITNGEYSIIRAIICFLISTMCNLFNKPISSLKSIIISLYIILLINPYAIFNVGLQLSYTSTLGIVVFFYKMEKAVFSFKPYSKISKMLKQKVSNNKSGYKVLSIFKKLFKSSISNVLLTVSAQIFSLPIQIVTFNTISPTMLLSNVLIFPFSTVVVFMGIISTLLSLLLPVFTHAITVTHPFLYAIDKISLNLAKITPKFNIPAQPEIIIFMYYIMIVLVILISKHIIRKKKIIKRYIKLSCIYILVIILIFIIFAICINIHIVASNNYIYFFNVEQGNCCFIRYNGKNIVIDCGSTKENVAFNALDNFLKSNAINKIDAVIITHFHTDHMNALSDILNNYEVEKLIYTPLKAYNENFESISKLTEKKNIKLLELVGESNANICGISIRVLAPDEEIIGDKLDFNANSLVFEMNINGLKYLFMGDATKETEEYLIKNKLLSNIYLLSVGHHGSKNATSEKFIEEVLPEVAIISAKKQVYGHPSDEVMAILKKYSCQVLITESNGAIKIKI